MKKFTLICGACMCFFMLGAFTVGILYQIKEIETWRLFLVTFLGILFIYQYTQEIKNESIKNKNEL